MRGVSLNEISAATRISTRFLEAIENDRWNELPGGAFNRGFIRSIARFLGLDEDSASGRVRARNEEPPCSAPDRAGNPIRDAPQLANANRCGGAVHRDTNRRLVRLQPIRIADCGAFT